MKPPREGSPSNTVGADDAWLDALLQRAIAEARDLARRQRDPLSAGITRRVQHLAPELTGRTGHVIDQRAELYSLGASLYEWLTGRPPFEELDPLRLVHEQLTRAPVAPAAIRPGIPGVLSEIVLRLLEKEPEQRYQGAEGLIHDLVRLRDAARMGKYADFALGERDFPARLKAPGRLVGRDREIEQLRQCVDEAAHGEKRVLVVSGAAGVGKSALVRELRWLVAARNGRFVEGRFGQYTRNEPFATLQALGALGRLLLTEPDDELALLRQRIVATLGSQAGIVCAVPEFKLLLGDIAIPAAIDPVQATARIGDVIFGLFRAVCSPQRPLAMVLDDLHWSRAAGLNLFDQAMTAKGLEGLVLVGAYRDDELAAEHPLRAALAGWSSRGYPLRHVHLGNLDVTEVAQILEHMLRIDIDASMALAQALAPHTGGNPYDTVELVNSLRQDGLLVPLADSWHWDADELRRYVARSGLLDLLQIRIARLPTALADTLRTIACLPPG